MSLPTGDKVDVTYSPRTEWTDREPQKEHRYDNMKRHSSIKMLSINHEFIEGTDTFHFITPLPRGATRELHTVAVGYEMEVPS